MPRPPRCRRICGAPQVDTFCPNGCKDAGPILLTLDEYEAIRLVDLEQQTHKLKAYNSLCYNTKNYVFCSANQVIYRIVLVYSVSKMF